MTTLRALRALGPIDAANIRRDPLLRWMIALPLALALLVRFGLPPVERWSLERFGLSLVPYQPLVGSFLVMLAPMLFGTVIGFLLLDQKDDGTLHALQVTPLGARGYLVYRMAVPVVLSVLITVLMLVLSGLPRLGLGDWLAAATAAPLGPAFALFLGAFARNKVEGFALMKAAGALNWPPIIAWFVALPWQWAFGLCPTFWAAKVYWMAARGERGVLLCLAIGLLYEIALLSWLTVRFERATTRGT